MKLIARILLLLLASLLLASCDRKPAPPMAFGAADWPGFEPFYLAQEQGFYAEASLRLTEYGGTSEVKRAMISREVQVAALPLGEAMLLRRDIPELKVVLLTDVSNGADAILAQPGISDVKQLQGKRIGMDSMGQGRYLLHLALRSAGVQDAQVEVLAVPANELEAAFRAHKVDAVVASGAMRVRLLEAGAQSLFDTSRAPGSLYDALVVRDDDVGKYHVELTRLVQGWQRALDMLNSEPDKARQSMAARKKLTPEQFGKGMQGIELLSLKNNRDLLAEEKPSAGPVLDSLQRFHLGLGLINIGADPVTVLDPVLLPEEKH